MERAKQYDADAVFFEAPRHGRPPLAQAFVYHGERHDDDQAFARLHQQLWSWGGVPLLYRKTRGRLQLFRCAHGPDFLRKGKVICKPFTHLDLALKVQQAATDPWWDAERLHSGALWQDGSTCAQLMSADRSAHKSLFDAIRRLSADLDEKQIFPKPLRRRLLILSLLVAYLEQRGVLPPAVFARFVPGAGRFFEVMPHGHALVDLLKSLEERFNGNVFTISPADAERLRQSTQLSRFAKLVEGREDAGGQMSLWERYSFKDLPVELISQIYQLFVEDTASSVYTPPFLVRFLVEEALSWSRLDRLHERGEVVLDPACGSGVFLVEAYKRLVLHWRARNGWARPDVRVLKDLLSHVHGVDREEGAVELAAFSLCLALCDALEPEAIRRSIKLFPALAGTNIHASCFFDARERTWMSRPVGVVLGNPPFASKLSTPGAQRSYDRFNAAHGTLPDKQLGYIFLHEAMEQLAEGGLLCMLQQYNFLYNQKSRPFRQRFFRQYKVRELLDFVSVRGLFQKGAADTKVVVVVIEKSVPDDDAKILHATFRRSGRTDAEQGVDLDYYDMHFVPRRVALDDDRVWRANLLGGGRALALARQLSSQRTLRQHARSKGWDHGEGYIEGKSVKRQPATHLTGHPHLPSDALVDDKVVRSKINNLAATQFRSAYSKKRFTPPMLLIREHIGLAHEVWTESYLTYSQRIVGFCAPKSDLSELESVAAWLKASRKMQQAHLMLTSPGLFAQKATALQAHDIYSLLYPEEKLKLSVNEEIVCDDIVDYYSDLVRLGESSTVMTRASKDALNSFNRVFCGQVNTVQGGPKLGPLEAHVWAGAICQPFCFGDGEVDWSGTEQLKDRIDALLRQPANGSLRMTGICRIYDGRFVFLLKPDRLRHWLRSTALRDADEVLADLRAQGY